MKHLDFGPGDDYAGKPGPQGDDLPGCVLATLNAIASAVVIAFLLLAGNPIHAAPFATEPIVGPAPCHSDTPWGCYANRLYLPVVAYDDIVVSDANAVPVDAIREIMAERQVHGMRPTDSAKAVDDWLWTKQP